MNPVIQQRQAVVVDSQNPLPNGTMASLGHSAAASLLAAVFTASLLHPFDLIKTRLQVSVVAGGAIPSYSSTVRAIGSIFAVEGTRGLYKGVAATLIASGASWGIFRFLFESTRQLDILKSPMPITAEKSNFSFSFNNNMTAGLIASFLATLVVHPLWFIKTRIELQSFESKKTGWIQYRGWLHCLSTVYKQEGIRAFYKGLTPALGMAPHAAIQLVLYEEFKNYGNDTDELLKVFLPFIRGAGSKLAAASLTYPFQVLRSRQQMYNSPYSNRSSYTIAREIAHTEGITGFYRGFAAHIQRAALQNGLMFLIFEELYRRMQ